MNPSIPSMIKSRPANDIKPPRLLMTALVISLFVAATFFATADHTAFAQPSGWPACYLTLDQIDEWGRQLEADHPALVERLEIGPSHCQEMGGCALPDGWWVEGDPIVVLVISNKSAATRKIGRLWLDAAVHPRELSTVPVVRAFAESLVDGYGSDAQITYLLDHFEVHVNPIANPDGRRVVELGAAAGGGGESRGSGVRTSTWRPMRTAHGRPIEAITAVSISIGTTGLCGRQPTISAAHAPTHTQVKRPLQRPKRELSRATSPRSSRIGGKTIQNRRHHGHCRPRLHLS